MAPTGHAVTLMQVFVLVTILSSCAKTEHPAPEPANEARDSLQTYTVNYPLAYFAGRLGPKNVEVVFPAPADVDPASWNPTAEDIVAFQGADLILLNGAGYAAWIRYATLPRSKVVVTSEGCREALPANEKTGTHQHGPKGKHMHTGTASTTWLDFRLAVCQAARIRDALTARLPTATAHIAKRYEDLESDLLALEARLRGVADAWGDKPLLASHPVYQYLADAHHLDIQSLHLEPDQVLTADDLRTLDALLAKHPAKLMLWEAAPLQSTAEELRKRGVAPVIFTPTSQPPSRGDFLTAMQENVARLECATGARQCL